MKDSSLGRLLGVLLKPGETFRSIAERPTWLLPMIVLILLGGGAQWLLQSRADSEEVIRAQMRAYGVTLTTEQMDKAVEQSQDPTRRNIGLVFGLLVAVAFNFIFAALLWMGFRLFASEIKYLPALSTAMYGLVPLGVAALLNVLLILVRGSVSVEEVTAGGVLMSNLGFLASEDTSVPLRGLFQSVDFFSIWAIALLVIGFQTTARTSKGTAAGVVLTVWLLGVGLKIGLMSLPLLLKGGS
jgi:Yip1 domain